MLITPADLIQCTGCLLKSCDLRNMIRRKSCAMSLLVGAEEEVKTVCPRKVILNPKPLAYRLNDNGHWLYSVPAPISLNIRCPNRLEDQRKMLQGQGYIKVPSSCTGYADGFILPPHF